MKEAKKEIKTSEEKRTEAQNRAMHLFFTQLAEALNESGFDIKKTIRADIPWNPQSVKELIWRPIQKLVLNKKSTTELKKQEDIDKVYDVVNRAISDRCKIHVPFPSIETAIDRERELENK